MPRETMTFLLANSLSASVEGAIGVGSCPCNRCNHGISDLKKHTSSLTVRGGRHWKPVSLRLQLRSMEIWFSVEALKGAGLTDWPFPASRGYLHGVLHGPSLWLPLSFQYHISYCRYRYQARVLPPFLRLLISSTCSVPFVMERNTILDSGD